MTVTHIDTAPAPIRNQYVDKRWGRSLSVIAPAHSTTDLTGTPLTLSQASLAAAYITSMAYANAVHFRVDPYSPIFAPIRDRLKASGDMRALTAFNAAYADELRLERQAQQAFQKQEAWAATAPSHAEVVAKNQAAAQADKLEIEIQQRGMQLLREREIAARAQAFRDARAQLGGKQ